MNVRLVSIKCEHSQLIVGGSTNDNVTIIVILLLRGIHKEH